MQTNYELYVMTGCPFCRKVTDFMAAHGIELPLRNVTEDAAARQTLLEVGGKVQCPCLFIDGAPLYESSDIVDYLAANLC